MSNDHILVQAEIQRTVENPLSYLFTYSAWHGMAWHGMSSIICFKLHQLGHFANDPACPDQVDLTCNWWNSAEILSDCSCY